MKTSRFSSAPLPPAADPVTPLGLRQRWVHFWFHPTDPIDLHAVRVLAGLLFLCWLLTFAGQEAALFGPQGWFDVQAYREAAHLPQGAPVPLGWSLLNACSPALLPAVYWGSVAVLCLFTLGLWTRLTSVLTWVVVVSFAANPVTGFEADLLLGILAFYLMVGYLLLDQWGSSPALATRLLGPWDTFLCARWLPGARVAASRRDRPASYAANLALRLLQVHFALVICVSGLHKLQFGDWWSGMALWYPLHAPFATTPESLHAAAAHPLLYLSLLSLASYAVLAWQISCPLFAWRQRWRPLLLAGGMLGWLGSVFLYRQPLFGPVLLIACLSYLTPAEWLWLRARLSRVVRLPATRSWPATVPAGAVRVSPRA